MQALATKKVLVNFDYLSTVSGGGYIGGWLSAWIKRTNLQNVQDQLAQHAVSGKPEPKEVQWLRRYSNYLTPRVGALSLDALTVGSTWLRNVLLNLVILVSFVASALLIPIAVLIPLGFWFSYHPDVAKWISLSCGLIALSVSSFNLVVKWVPTDRQWPWLLTPVGILCCVVSPCIIACFTGSFWLVFADFRGYSWVNACIDTFVGFVVIVGFAWMVGLGYAKRFTSKNSSASREPTVRLSDSFYYFCASAAAVPLGAVLLSIARNYLPTEASVDLIGPNLQMIEVTTWGPPIILLIFAVSLSIWIGLVGRAYREPSREWWSRAGGAFFMASALLFAWFGFAFYVPYWVHVAIGHLDTWSATLKAVLSSAWLASLFGALKLASQTSQPKASKSPTWRTFFGTVLATLFAVGLFVAIACGTHNTLDAISQWRGHPIDDTKPYWDRLNQWNGGGWLNSAVVLLGISAITTLLFGWRVDINRFSLHNMYKNRIIRCYLGASNPDRRAQPFTGFDGNDDIPLASLIDPAGYPQKPCHIINTAMNLVQGSELAWQQRKAASFVLTPSTCGFAMATAQGDGSLAANDGQLPGFQPTSVYATHDPGHEEKGISLGMAVATSGAAASPNMGANTQPALAALMTFFDIRLGRWSPNPAGSNPKRSSPRFGLIWLLSELLGFTNERRAFVYLSDGGHFENMAIYELVRRRCIKIVCVDAGADPKRSFEDLGNMLRKCRVDLATEIAVDLEPLYGNSNDGRSKSGFVRGTIHYPIGANNIRLQGELLLIKPSLLHPPTEAADIFNYASATAFPQESTADQWFDESQFESYRSLGFKLATEALDRSPTFL